MEQDRTELDRTDPLTAVETASAERRAADEAAAVARDAQTDAIRRALTAGVPATRLRDATGLSLARIYQVRDGRR